MGTVFEVLPLECLRLVPMGRSTCVLLASPIQGFQTFFTTILDGVF